MKEWGRGVDGVGWAMAISGQTAWRRPCLEALAGEGEEKDSLGCGLAPCCRHHGGPVSPPHPLLHLLPESLDQVTRWGQGEKGNSHPPT